MPREHNTGEARAARGGRRRWGGLLLGAALLALLLSACGVSTGGPAAIPRNQVPFNLLGKNSPPTSTTTPPPGSYIGFDVYLVDANNQLVGSTRYMSIRPTPTLRGALSQNLFQTPTDPSTDLSNYLGTVGLVGASVSGPTSGQVAVVDVDAAFLELSGTDLPLAVGQVVLTTSSFEHAVAPNTPISVQFEVDGTPVSVPEGNGVFTASPVSPLAYLNLEASSS